MMIFNLGVVSLRSQTNDMQRMNNSEMSTQNIPNLHVGSLDENELKRINADDSKYHVCYTDDNES